jgi:hypothetical protein
VWQWVGIHLNFITHESPLIRKQHERGHAEIGLHPNLIEGSSQGNDIVEIISYLENLYPDVKCFRNHRYFDSNDVNDYMFQRGYKYDSNVCTDLEIVKPFFHRSGLLRIPIFMEDGGYLLKKHKLNFESRHRIFFEKGLKVINVHPMHMALNSPSFAFARKLKDKLTRDEWNNLSEGEIENLSYKGLGIRTFIISLIENIKASDSRALLETSEILLESY